MRTRLVLGAIPLLIYPFVALADIMSLAAFANGGGPLLLKCTALGFQILSLAYPLVFIGSLTASLLLKPRSEKTALKFAALPLWYLAFIMVLFVAWFALDSLQVGHRAANFVLRGDPITA